jgi:hypothetical protein
MIQMNTWKRSKINREIHAAMTKMCCIYPSVDRLKLEKFKIEVSLLPYERGGGRIFAAALTSIG